MRRRWPCMASARLSHPASISRCHPGYSLRNDGVILHHADLPVDDIVQQAGFRATTVLRAIVDVAAGKDEDQLARAKQEGRDGRCSLSVGSEARAEAC